MFFGLYLCEAAIDEQLRSGDVAAIVASEKQHGLRDFIGCAESAEWNGIADHLPALLTCFRGGEQVVQSGRVDGAWTHRVHTDAALLQVPLIPPCQTADPCRFIAKLLEISPK
jgi:hypothetical protein